MATPNLVNVDTITPVNSTALLDGTSRTTVIDVTAEYCAKVNTLLIGNADGTNDATITVEVSVDNGSNFVVLVKTVNVPAGSTLSILPAPIYLDETDLLYVTASEADDLTYFASYELMKDS